VLTVPDSAVIDTGTRRIVLVQVKEGRFEPREVELGARGENYIEVVKGLKEGEPVVVAANFLIDAESNLKAAVGGFGGPASPGSPAKGSEPLAPANAGSAAASATVGHKAQAPWTASISSGHTEPQPRPVASLKWPAMTMEFKAANAALLSA